MVFLEYKKEFIHKNKAEVEQSRKKTINGNGV